MVVADHPESLVRLIFHAAPSQAGAPGSGGGPIPSDLTTCPSDRSHFHFRCFVTD